VLNSDTEVQPGALEQLVGYLDEHPRVAVVGPRLLHPDGTVQSSRRRFPRLVTFLMESTQLQRFWPRNAVLDHFYAADRSDEDEQHVDWLSGACLAVNGLALAEIGGFDERFFLYSEELDWCRRFRAAGWQVAYLPGAEVKHLEGGSSRANLVARDVNFQSAKLLYVEKWHGRWAARVVRAYLMADYLFRAAEENIKLRLGSQVETRRARLPVIRAVLTELARGW
jgi:GT2 family glycosyltransferase